jgi:hypothetical protein
VKGPETVWYKDQEQDLHSGRRTLGAIPETKKVEFTNRSAAAQLLATKRDQSQDRLNILALPGMSRWPLRCTVSLDSQQSSPGNTCKVTGIAVGSSTVAYILFYGLPKAPPTYRRAGRTGCAARPCRRAYDESQEVLSPRAD